MGAPQALSREYRKILVRVPNWIGDAVMATPALGALRSTFPEATLVVAADPRVADLFRPHPYCDGVLDYDRRGRHRGPLGVLRFAWELRRECFDLAILLQNAIEAAIVAFLAGIPRRAGYRSDFRGALLTHGVSVGGTERRLHHTEYYRNMLARIGITGGYERLCLICTAEEQDWAAKTLGPGRWVAIHPGATYGSAKRWFPERFAAVADHLAVACDARIVLIGGEDAIEAARAMELGMSHPPLNMAGRTSLRQFMAIVGSCSLLVTNDSGPMHVGAALGVPVVAIFGPTDHTTTSPLSAHYRLVRKPTDCAPCLRRNCPTDHRCMTAITAADVSEAAADLLESCS